MPYIYQVYTEYWDEELDRFWFTTTSVTSDTQLSQRAILAEADDLIAEKLAGPQYEQLRQYLATEPFEPIQGIISAIFIPSG